ncbi:hypothetical protein C8R46DRAFT_881971, partial [Mycena filopes]
MLDHLAVDRARVAELEGQILRLQDRLRDLELDRHRTQQRLDSYRYPILELPTDITCEIFIHSLPVYPSFPRLTDLGSPTLLTQICRQWRSIALDTPTLWRAMSLTSDSIEQESYLFDLWLNRSGSCPLSVNFCDWYSEAELPVLRRVLQHSPRLDELRVVLPVHPMLKTPHPLPMLRRLDLTLSGAPVPQDIVLFSDAPQLRTVILHLASLRVLLPWFQITSLTL